MEVWLPPVHTPWGIKLTDNWMTSWKSSLYWFSWCLKCHSRISSASVVSLLPLFVLRVEKVKSTLKPLTPYDRPLCSWLCIENLVPVEAGLCRLGGGCSRRGRGWTQQWQTGWQPWAAELWDTVICCLQLPGWLHSLYSKYLLTTHHVEDTLLGPLRDTQECDILHLSGKEFLVWLQDSYQLQWTLCIALHCLQGIFRQIILLSTACGLRPFQYPHNNLGGTATLTF